MPMKVIDDITARLKLGETITVSQVPNDTAQAWLITELLNTTLIKKSGALILVKNQPEADKMYQQLLFWKSIKKINLPILLANEKLTEILYYQVHHLPYLAIIGNDQELNTLPLPDDFIKTITTCSLEQNIKPAEIITQLTNSGYSRQNKVFTKGEYSRRGEIFDVFSPGYNLPLRIIFNNNIISDINFFNPLSQRAEKKINTCHLLPIKTNPGNGSIKNYLNKNTVIFQSADLPISFINQPTLQWQLLTSIQALPIGFTIAPSFKYNKPGLIDWLNEHLDCQVIFTTPEYSDWSEKFPNLIIKENSFLSGCQNEELKLLIATSEELPKIYTAKINLNTLLETPFQAGDYVVHIDHGIGHFVGTTWQDYNGAKKEFFEITYAANDKLFVPIEKADRLSRYIGLDRPVLHRLSGASWQQLKLKVTKDIYQTAQALIRLYAQREIIEVDPINQTWPEEKELASDFPYQETADQLKALDDIVYDLKQTRPMDRLICGDVGFGKTEVALRTALKIVLSGKQVALLCPTTILAQQHFDTFTARLEKFGVRIGLLSRFRDKSNQTATIKELTTGQLDIVIGTHRILSDDVSFQNLGLLIIDEEQKFGVLHKEKLKQFRNFSHTLTLSATPIPRTMYFSLVNLRPLSVIQTSPHGRKPINTFIEKYDEEKIKQVIEQEIKRQGQIYYIYNQVERIEVKAKLLQKLIPHARLAVAHGQLPARKLAAIMHDFDQGKNDILVCSTIIENGLDLPNVNTLIVEQANHFGLAQLYQLRGRIGRSDRQAFAYFFYSAEKLEGLAAKRLHALSEANELGSGLGLAKQDMEIRGIGNLLGKSQHGHLQAIGLQLYLRLVEQTVTELKTGIIETAKTDVQINLPIPFYIPDNLVTSQESRLNLYQDLSQAQTRSEIDKIIIKKFGKKPLPDKFKNLLDILELKITAQNVGIDEITTQEKNKITFIICSTRTNFTDAQTKKIKKIKLPWQVSEKNIKIELLALGNDWLKTLLHSIQALH
jgi:transcription-repair coupling factor (superfamily II helicase)